MAGPLKQVHVSPSGVQRSASCVIESDESFTAVATTLGTNIYSSGQLRSVLSGHNRAVVAISYEYPYLVSIGSDDLLLGFHVPREAEIVNRQLAASPTAVSLRPGSATEGVLATSAQVATFSLENAYSRVLFSNHSCVCVQWHPTQPLVACGFSGSSGSIVRLKDAHSASESVEFNPSKALPSTQAKALGDVALIRWDPLGQAYFLAAYSSFGILLWDSATQQLLKAFPNTSARHKISSALWLSSAPGLFITAGVHSGVLTIWNASQDAPVASERVPGVNGVHDLVAKRAPGTSSTPHTISGVGSDWAAKENLLVATRDGGVVGFSCAQRRVTWQAPTGHTDTVFDAAFSPGDASILATCSFDSFVRLWSAEDYSCVDSFKVSAAGPNPVCLYTLAWAPGSDGRIATADNNGNVFVVNTRSGAVRSFLSLHPAPVLRLAWSRQRPSWVASTSTNGMALVWNPNSGEVVRKITHLQPSHGVAWQEVPSESAAASPPPQLLLGNASGSIMRWDIGSTDAPQTVKAHSSVVFNVAASPLAPHLVASASNDGNVAIWNTLDDTVMLLRGHSDRIRALTWHTELVHVLITGSWDCTIRVWDTSSGRCLGVCHEHRSDVYAVATHPARPDTFVSVSRDSTLRWWKMNRPSSGLRSALLAAAGIHLLHGGGEGHLRAPHYLDSATQQVAALLQYKPSPGFSSANQALSVSCSVAQILRFALLHPTASGKASQGPLLAGTTSQQLGNLLRVDLSGQTFDPLHLLEGLLTTIAVSAGTQALLGTLRTAAGDDSGAAVAKYGSLMAKSILYPNGDQPIIPQSLVHRASLAAAAEMDVRTCSTHVRIGGPKRNVALQAAASMYMRTGQMEQYCHVQAELGNWEAALAAAPAVSMQFWQGLLRKRVDTLAHASLAEREPLMLLTGQKHEVVHQHTQQGAVLLAAALASSETPQLASGPLQAAATTATMQPIVQPLQATTRAINGQISKGNALPQSVQGLFSKQALEALAAGKPTLAAAWHLSGGLLGTPDAIATLLRANETESAWVLSCAVPAHFSRGVVSDTLVTTSSPRLVGGQLTWVNSSFQPKPLIESSPTEECARRMCLRCFRHGLWGAGIALLQAAGFSAAEVSLQAAQIPLTAGLVALPGKILAEEGLSASTSRWLDACNTAAVMSSGMTSDTAGALRQVPPRSDERVDAVAFAPYSPSLSRLVHGQPGNELQQHMQLDSDAETNLPLTAQALRGLAALYSSLGMQPRHKVLDERNFDLTLSGGDVAGAVAMLIRAGEYSMAAQEACDHLHETWARGAAPWSGAALAGLDLTISSLFVSPQDVPETSSTHGAFWSLAQHPQAQVISQLSRLLRYIPMAVLPLDLKQSCLLFGSLFAFFDAMSRGFTSVITPMCRFLSAQAGSSGIQLPLPFNLLRLVQGMYELTIGGDPQKCLIALQRYCATPMKHGAGESLPGHSLGGMAASRQATALYTGFAAANSEACALAEKALPVIKQLVAQVAAAPQIQRQPTQLGVLPVSMFLPGTCTSVNEDVAFQQQDGTAAAAGSPAGHPAHFSSAVSGTPVRRGAMTLEDGFIATEREAVEWALVCPTSPTGSGEWLVPF